MVVWMNHHHDVRPGFNGQAVAGLLIAAVTRVHFVRMHLHAFQSAGQRCSALRVLYVQKDVEKKVLEMLVGALATLEVGDPWLISTDVGPVIDEEAEKAIGDYCAAMEGRGRLMARLDAPQGGRFVAPHIFRVSGIAEMEKEVFGPVLHVASFDAEDIDRVIAEVAALADQAVDGADVGGAEAGGFRHGRVSPQVGVPPHFRGLKGDYRPVRSTTQATRSVSPESALRTGASGRGRRRESSDP